MARCRACRSEFDAERQYCPKCGVGAELATDLETMAVEPPPADDDGAGRRARSERLGGAVLSLLGVALIAGGAYTAYLGFTGQSPAARVDPPVAVTPSRTTASSSPSPTGSALPSGGLVEVAPALRSRPDVSGVVATLEQYFVAINERDYEAYVDSLTAIDDRAVTEDEFFEGYQSTHNSRVRLVGMASATDGDDVSATVTFRSEQDPRDSPDGESDCLDWVVTFPMVATDEGFRIDIVRLFATTYHPC